MRRQKYNMTPKERRDHMVGVMLSDEEYEALLEVCNCWDYSYSSAIRITIMQTYERLKNAGMIKEDTNAR